MDGRFKFIDLFAGIGGMRIPFEELGGECVFSSEYDRHCQDMYEANFGERPRGDITKIPSFEIPDHDVLLAGFPCQSFSIIGNGMGFADTRGTLFFEVERILRDKKPAAFLLENVKRLATHDGGRTFRVMLSKLDGLGYHVHFKIMNALDYGLPQKRERVLIAGFRENHPFFFPRPIERRLTLKDLLQDHSQVARRHFASEYIVRKRMERVGMKALPRPAIWHENKAGNVGVNEFCCALRAGGSHNYLLVDGIRRLTSQECLALQGFPPGFKIASPDAQVRRQAGNSVPVPMIREVARQMLTAMEREPLSPEIRPSLVPGQARLSIGVLNGKQEVFG
jgi:DNA (cytosine-5)-methyltransferase 1